MTDTSGPDDDAGRAERVEEDADDRPAEPERAHVAVDVDDAVDFLHHPDLSPDEVGEPGRP